MAFKVFNLAQSDAETLARIASGDLSPGLSRALLALSEAGRYGLTVAIVGTTKEFTPNEAATILGMSRTHLYRLLDSGELISCWVGSDRRIAACDLAELEVRRQAGRRELAERFASHDQTRRAAAIEVTNLR